MVSVVSPGGEEVEELVYKDGIQKWEEDSTLSDTLVDVEAGGDGMVPCD